MFNFILQLLRSKIGPQNRLLYILNHTYIFFVNFCPLATAALFNLCPCLIRVKSLHNFDFLFCVISKVFLIDNSILLKPSFILWSWSGSSLEPSDHISGKHKSNSRANIGLICLVLY
jgi:hypothetical protein